MIYQTKQGKVKQFIFFRCGRKLDMLARCQFGMLDGKCGAMLVYPLPEFSWRHTIVRSYDLDIPFDVQERMVQEVFDIAENHPEECVLNDNCYADNSEKPNSITRDRNTDVPCHDVHLFDENYQLIVSLILRDGSDILQGSLFYKTIMNCLEPYEMIKEQTKRKKRKLP